MTLKNVKVLLHWLDEDDGGKTILPPGPRYSTVAKFNKIEDKWPKIAWSIILKIDPSKYNGRQLIAGMELLSEEAPQDLLNIGEKFDLYEGYNLVAHGEIISPTNTTA